jgi:hypothetical protein
MDKCYFSVDTMVFISIAFAKRVFYIYKAIYYINLTFQDFFNWKEVEGELRRIKEENDSIGVIKTLHRDDDLGSDGRSVGLFFLLGGLENLWFAFENNNPFGYHVEFSHALIDLRNLVARLPVGRAWHHRYPQGTL